MPQEFHVLRCYSCETFQVHIVKKSNKWCCKMCGENQSLKKVYGQGSGKDCRKHVQSLNEKRRMNDLNESENIINDSDNDIEETESCNNTTPKFEANSSKWSEYLTEENELPEPECDTNSLYTFERPNKRKKKEQQSNEYKNNDEYENNKKKLKNDSEDTENNFERKYNSSVTKNVQTNKQIFGGQQSKWSSFVMETEANPVNVVNTPNFVPNIFDSTDLSSLDDILDL